MRSASTPFPFDRNALQALYDGADIDVEDVPAQYHDLAVEASRIIASHCASSGWRSVCDLPLPSTDDDEHRCVVVWQDCDHTQDQGAELCTLAMIRDGDYCGPRMAGAVWRSIMDAPPMEVDTANAEVSG